MIRLSVRDPAAMAELGRRLGSVLVAGDLVVLVGELGAGKTTLTRGIGEAMRVRGPITSPTFVLSRVHPPLESGGVPLVHVDAYRLSGARELDDLDIDWDGSVAVVEWGDGLLDGVADSWLRVAIERPHGASQALNEGGARDDGSDDDATPRDVTIEGFGPEWPALRLASRSLSERSETTGAQGFEVRP